MPRFHLVLLPLAALAGLACGGGGSQSTTTSGTGGTGTTSSSVTSTTASAGGGSTSSAGTTSSSSAASSGGTGGEGTGGAGGQQGTGTGGSGGAGPCVGNIDLTVDNGALQHLTFECKGDRDANQWTTPVGYEFSGNLPGEPHGLEIVGCKTAAANSEGVVLSALNAEGVGTFMSGTPQYTDPNGMTWGIASDPFDMVVTKLGGAGEPIVGTFTATASNGGNAAHNLSGSFHVCHGADFLPP